MRSGQLTESQQIEKVLHHMTTSVSGVVHLAFVHQARTSPPPVRRALRPIGSPRSWRALRLHVHVLHREVLTGEDERGGARRALHRGDLPGAIQCDISAERTNEHHTVSK